MSILDYFPRKLQPRAVQKDALLALEDAWDKASIFVVNLPVASGKSALAMTIAHYHKQCSIITPSKLLVNQYKEEYKYVHVLRAKSDYYCSVFDCPVSKRPGSKKAGMLCKKDVGCVGCQSYLKDLRKARVMPYLLSNYHIYLAHKLYRDVLVVDEAHSLIDTLKQMATKNYWQFKHRYPDGLCTRNQIKDWINSLPEAAFKYNYRQDGDRTHATSESLQLLKDELNSHRPKSLVEIGEEDYRGKRLPCIKLVPLDIRDAPPIMWPSQVKKIIFMSATMSRKDIEQLGLADKRIQYIQADSPIRAEQRPVIIPPEAASMSWRMQNQNIPALVRFLCEAAVHHDKEKGLIHTTYSLAKKLREYEGWPEHIKARLLFHDKSNKATQYQRFREADPEEGSILVASGMYEGIDLPYDAGRWQVIAKVPWPSLADPAIKFLCQEDEEWYAWETIKTMLQACGRICRTPTDFGATYIFDKTFRRLYDENSNLFPEWFKRSVSFI